ncbi:MAG: hypothetical protein U0992_17510 [Planctomycetaceae bacterium]
MSRKLAVRWRSARFGLNLIYLSCLAVGLLFLARSIAAVGLAPLIVSRQISGFLGFSLAAVLGALSFGLVRSAFQRDVEYFRWLLIFVAGAVATCLISTFSPGRLDPVLQWLPRSTTYVLYGAAAASLLGCFYCVSAWGSLKTWVSAAATFAALIGAALFMLVANPVSWATPWIPPMLRGSAFSTSPLVTAVALACVAVFCHSLYLRHLSRTVQDSATADYADDFRRFHLIGSAVILAAVFWKADRAHEVGQVVGRQRSGNKGSEFLVGRRVANQSCPVARRVVQRD